MKDMVLKGYLRIDLFPLLPVIFTDQPFHNKIQILFNDAGFRNNLLFFEISYFKIRPDQFVKLFFAEVNEFIQKLKK